MRNLERGSWDFGEVSSLEEHMIGKVMVSVM